MVDFPDNRIMRSNTTTTTGWRAIIDEANSEDISRVYSNFDSKSVREIKVMTSEKNYRALLATNRYMIWLDNNQDIRWNLIYPSEEIFKAFSFLKNDYGKLEPIKETGYIMSKTLSQKLIYMPLLDLYKSLHHKQIKWADESFMLVMAEEKEKIKNMAPIDKIALYFQDRCRDKQKIISTIFGDVMQFDTKSITKQLSDVNWDIPWHGLPYYSMASIFKCEVGKNFEDNDLDSTLSSSRKVICRRCLINLNYRSCTGCGIFIYPNIDKYIQGSGVANSNDRFHSQDCFLDNRPKEELENGNYKFKIPEDSEE